TVTVTDANGCTASATTTVAINPLPAVSFSGLMPVYCSEDAPALLTGTPAGGTFSGQGISGNTFYPGIAGPGNWDIVYAYTNSFGCENSDTMTVTVNPSPVATVSADTTICQGGTAVVFAGGGSTYLWSNGSTNTAIFVSPLITTTYDVTVTNSFGCTDNASVTVTVNPQPLVNAGGDLEVCLGQSIQLDVTATGAGTVYGYQWTPAVGLSDPSIKNPMASPTATTTYAVLVTSGLGCTASDDVVVTVNPLPNANAGQDMTLCFGTTTTLTATPAGMSYLWSTGQTAQSIVVVAGDTATYFVTVTNGFGCSAVDSVTLASFPLPSAIVSPTQTICEFELAYISATGAGVGGTYSWSSVPPGFSANGPNHIVQPADSTIYYVTVTDLNGCTNINNTIVNVNPKPVVYAGPDQSVCENHTVTLDAGTGFDNYLWSNGVPQQVIQVDSTGVGIGTIIYSVTVTLDGCAAMDEVVVEFMPCPGLDELSAESIEINVFPNPNDGRFTVTVKGFEGSVDLLILNNIGQTVVNEKLNHSSNSLFSRDYDLSSFPPGMYFLRFSDGDIVRTRKVIIQ
ncbi:MAG: T9SS type A sorting domain-containing protein, partial [Bacteroidales bacterium]|nr:T9SS type A sorting domain-containing protein [Bacteroidales bacterium]